MKNNLVYGIKIVGKRVYIGVDEKIENFISVYELKDSLMLKEEKYAKELCNSSKLTIITTESWSFRMQSKIFRPKKLQPLNNNNIKTNK